MKHCPPVANFAGNTGDIAALKKEKDMDTLRVASSNVRLSVSKTLLEWEGGPTRGYISKGALINGLAKLTNDKRLPENTKVEMVTLSGLNELVQ